MKPGTRKILISSGMALLLILTYSLKNNSPPKNGSQNLALDYVVPAGENMVGPANLPINGSNNEKSENWEQAAKSLAQVSIIPLLYRGGEGIDAEIAKKLGISEAQLAQINKSIFNALTKLKTLETEHARVIKDENGLDLVEISSFETQGDEIRTTLESDLTTAAPHEMRDVIKKNVLSSAFQEFSDFGMYRRLLYFEASDDEIHEPSIMVELKFALREGLPPLQRRVSLTPAIRSRYDYLAKLSQNRH